MSSELKVFPLEVHFKRTKRLLQSLIAARPSVGFWEPSKSFRREQPFSIVTTPRHSMPTFWSGFRLVSIFETSLTKT